MFICHSTACIVSK